MADDLGIMLTELPEATNIGDDDLMYIVQENNSEKVKVATLRDAVFTEGYEETTGNPITITNGSASALVECKTDIEPIQDLHGYDKPWAGGAGKNKLVVTASLPTTINGITFAWNEDGTLNVSGQASGEVFLWVNGGTGIILEDNTAYTMSVEGLGNSQRIEVQLCERETSGSGLTYDFSRNADGNGNFTTKSGWYMRDARIHISSGADFRTPLNLKMMVELGSTATTFEPYANICPISGHSSVTINVSPTSDPSQGLDTTIQLGNTYYGGTLDVTRGILTITHATTNVNTVITNRTTSYSNPVFYGEISGMKAGSQTVIAEAFNGIESKLSAQNFANNSNNGDCANNSNNTQFFIRADEYTDVPSLKADLGTTKIRYELATPITVQLTPAVINTLSGHNVITSSTGELDIVYVVDNAPIKPNPSGTPDAELSGIEINGKNFEIIKELPAFPTSNGNYKLKLSISNGVPTLSWVSDT